MNVFLLYSVFFLVFNNMRELKDFEKLEQQNHMRLGKISIFQASFRLKLGSLSFLDTTKLLPFFPLQTSCTETHSYKEALRR